MKFLITGGLGFIGSEIAKLLDRNGHSVIIIDNLHTGKIERIKELNNCEFINLDIRQRTKLEDYIKNIDGIFHEAALTSVPESFQKKDEYYDVNVNGTKNIFEIAHKKKIKVVFASSSSVYGEIKKIPINENTKKNPINPYGDTKLINEELAEQFCIKNTSIIGLRYFNVYGVGQNEAYAGVISKFIKKIKKDQSPSIFGTGEQIRDFIYVEDVARANIIAMESGIKSGFFNIGTGKGTSIIKIADILIKISNKNISPEFLEPLTGDIKISLADISLSKKLLGWQSKTDLQNGLERIYEKF